jgi:hypothetical protein
MDIWTPSREIILLSLPLGCGRVKYFLDAELRTLFALNYCVLSGIEPIPELRSPFAFKSSPVGSSRIPDAELESFGFHCFF